MEKRRRVLRVAAAIVVAVATATIGTAPAAAAPVHPLAAPPKPPKPKGTPIASVTVKASSIKGNTSTQDLTCVAYWSPEPQYSASNNTIHYGVFVNCNYAAELTMKIQIFVKPPSGPYEPADNPITNYAVGNTGSVGGVTACFAGSSGTWLEKFWGTAAAGGNFVPYPALSPAHVFPCV